MTVTESKKKPIYLAYHILCNVNTAATARLVERSPCMLHGDSSSSPDRDRPKFH